jgi:hypothetical protein
MNIASGCEGASCQGKFNNTPISSLGILPTTLLSLDISYTSITGLFDISGLYL